MSNNSMKPFLRFWRDLEIAVLFKHRLILLWKVGETI